MTDFQICVLFLLALILILLGCGLRYILNCQQVLHGIAGTLSSLERDSHTLVQRVPRFPRDDEL